MKLYDLFNNALNISDEVITEEQKASIFLNACFMFFGIVNVHIKTNNIEDLEILGSYIIKEQKKSLVDDGLIFYTIKPDDIYSFNLPFEYCNDFIEVCKFLIIDTSLKNINQLKNLGVTELPIQNDTKEAVKNYLTSRYNIEAGATIL